MLNENVMKVVSLLPGPPLDPDDVGVLDAVGDVLEGLDHVELLIETGIIVLKRIGSKMALDTGLCPGLLIF